MPLRDIDFPAKDVPLKEDVARLGALVGDMLREQEGEAFFERVERTRTAAIRRRQTEENAAEELRTLARSLDAGEAAELVRAFSAYFQVVNLAEQIHRIRRRREYLSTGDEPQPGGCRAAFRTLSSSGLGNREIADGLGRLVIEPVFTAHPTEATRRIILEKEERIGRLLVERLDGCTELRKERIDEEIREEITATWQTAQQSGQRPTVADEREHVLFYLTDVLWSVLPELHERVAAAFEDELGDEVEASLSGRGLRFASWVGGDMDGNPNVTAETLRATLERHRELALDLHRRDVHQVSRFLSQSPSRVEIDPAVRARAEEYGRRFPEVLEALPRGQRDLPYLVLLRLVAARLEATAEGDEEGYAAAQELEADLELVAESLEGHGGRRAGLGRVRDLLRRVRAFGFHLATLDTRQDALVLRRVVGRLLGSDDWLERSPEERREGLGRPAPARPSTEEVEADDDEVHRTLEVFRALAEARRRYGPDALGPFIISMTAGADDVLSVLWLAREAGFVDEEGRVPLDVAPLLETVPDLRNAPDILEALLDDPGYRAHLRARGDRQTVMIGYSDSNKDGGVAASRWALQSAQSAVVDVLTGAGVSPTIFHGRGGTVGRGGGKTHRAILASPRGSVAGHFRVTEQGEIIQEKYGLAEIALRELERMAAATLLATLRTDAEDDEAAAEGWPSLMETVARESRRAYRSLVYEEPEFARYFRLATPIDVIERMPIGSRPSSRRSGRGIEDLRAIPWVFSWMQSRHLLPGWFGLGSGLQAAVEEHGRAPVEAMVRGWPFLRTVLDDVEMVLAKADLGIAERYAELAGEVGDRIFPRIRAELELTVELVTRLRGRDGILADDPTLSRSIRLRNPYVDPMSLLQVDLLARWREGGEEDDALLDALIQSVIGISEGMRNTG